MLLDDGDVDNGQKQLDEQLHRDVRELAKQGPDFDGILVCMSSFG